MQFFKKTNIDFIGKRVFFFWFSTILSVTGILAVIFMGIEFGIDFAGGSELTLKFKNNVTTEDIRGKLATSGLEASEIKSYGEGNQFIIRMKKTDKGIEQLKKVMDDNYKASGYEILGENTIGAKIGNEMRRDAFIAVILAVIGILIYVAFRFEFIFGLGAIIALIHDVILTFTMLIIAQHLGLGFEVDGTILAALLTVIGFSINDTVIIFDRIRENKEKMKGIPMAKYFNMSINETLSRTVNTVLTVVLVLITMVLLGGAVLRGFSFTMLLGILFGTYSSIYIASSYVLYHYHHFRKVDVDGTDGEKKTAVAKA
jgi:preprotein translocase subunit SecF